MFGDQVVRCFRRSSETPRTPVTICLYRCKFKPIILPFDKAPGFRRFRKKKNTMSDLKHSFKLRGFFKPDLWGLLAYTVFLSVPGPLSPRDTRLPRRPPFPPESWPTRRVPAAAACTPIQQRLSVQRRPSPRVLTVASWGGGVLFCFVS